MNRQNTGVLLREISKRLVLKGALPPNLDCHPRGHSQACVIRACINAFIEIKARSNWAEYVYILQGYYGRRGEGGKETRLVLFIFFKNYGNDLIPILCPLNKSFFPLVNFFFPHSRRFANPKTRFCDILFYYVKTCNCVLLKFGFVPAVGRKREYARWRTKNEL